MIYYKEIPIKYVAVLLFFFADIPLFSAGGLWASDFTHIITIFPFLLNYSYYIYYLQEQYHFQNVPHFRARESIHLRDGEKNIRVCGEWVG